MAQHPGVRAREWRTPLAAIWAASLLLDHLGEAESAGLLMDAIRHVAKNGPYTRDPGGSAKTTDVGTAIVEAIGRH